MRFTILMNLTFRGIFNLGCVINIVIVFLSYWPLRCTSYITFIDIMNIAKQILHQFYIVSLDLVYIKHLVYIDKEDIVMFSHIEWHWVFIMPLLPCLHRRQRWHSNAAGQNQIDVELYILSSCLHRKFGRHRATSRLHRTLSIFFASSTSQCWPASSLHWVSSYPYYFIFMVNVAMFGDIKLTLRLAHTLSIMFLHRRLGNVGHIELTLCLHCVPSILFK